MICIDFLRSHHKFVEKIFFTDLVTWEILYFTRIGDIVVVKTLVPNVINRFYYK